MFEHFSRAALQAGKIVPLTLASLPGEPVIGVEHLGPTNVTLTNDEIARANAKETSRIGKSKNKQAKLSRASFDEMRAQNRETVRKHVVRKLIDVKHSDGRAAVDDEISAFVDALPDETITEIVLFAVDASNFRDEIESEAKVLAGKS